MVLLQPGVGTLQVLEIYIELRFWYNFRYVKQLLQEEIFFSPSGTTLEGYY